MTSGRGSIPPLSYSAFLWLILPNEKPGRPSLPILKKRIDP